MWDGTCNNVRCWVSKLSRRPQHVCIVLFNQLCSFDSAGSAAGSCWPAESKCGNALQAALCTEGAALSSKALKEMHPLLHACAGRDATLTRQMCAASLGFNPDYPQTTTTALFPDAAHDGKDLGCMHMQLEGEALNSSVHLTTETSAACIPANQPCCWMVCSTPASAQSRSASGRTW